MKSNAARKIEPEAEPQATPAAVVDFDFSTLGPEQVLITPKSPASEDFLSKIIFTIHAVRMPRLGNGVACSAREAHLFAGLVIAGGYQVTWGAGA